MMRFRRMAWVALLVEAITRRGFDEDSNFYFYGKYVETFPTLDSSETLHVSVYTSNRDMVLSFDFNFETRELKVDEYATPKIYDKLIRSFRRYYRVKVI